MTKKFHILFITQLLQHSSHFLQHSSHYLLLATCILLTASCSMIHEFPEEGKEIDPTIIETNVNIKAKISLMFHTVITKSGKAIDINEETADKYDRRFIVAVRNAEFDDNLVERYIITRPVEDTSALQVYTHLHARKYTIAVWMDFVLKGTDEDCYFNVDTTSLLSSISIRDRESYVAGSDYKECQHYVQQIDLTPYAGEWYCDITLEAPLERRMAKITFLADDLESYAENIEWKHSLDSLAANMQVEFVYNGYFPSGFNAWTGRLNNSETGYGFNFNCYYPTELYEQDYSLVGSDYVFVNGESSSVNVTAIIRDKAGNIVNEVNDITVPITRGAETVIIYKFFTKEYVPGIGINPDFDGEFNVYV